MSEEQKGMSAKSNKPTNSNGYDIEYEEVEYEPVDYEPIEYEPIEYEPIEYEPLTYEDGSSPEAGVSTEPSSTTHTSLLDRCINIVQMARLLASGTVDEDILDQDWGE